MEMSDKEIIVKEKIFNDLNEHIFIKSLNALQTPP